MMTRIIRMVTMMTTMTTMTMMTTTMLTRSALAFQGSRTGRLTAQALTLFRSLWISSELLITDAVTRAMPIARSTTTSCRLTTITAHTMPFQQTLRKLCIFTSTSSKTATSRDSTIQRSNHAQHSHVERTQSKVSSMMARPCSPTVTRHATLTNALPLSRGFSWPMIPAMRTIFQELSKPPCMTLRRCARLQSVTLLQTRMTSMLSNALLKMILELFCHELYMIFFYKKK